MALGEGPPWRKQPLGSRGQLLSRSSRVKDSLPETVDSQTRCPGPR